MISLVVDRPSNCGSGRSWRVHDDRDPEQADECAGCCYAKQDKFWVQDAPNGERWEVYTVLSDSETFSGRDDAEQAVGCCVSDDGTQGAGRELAASATACC